MWPYLALSSALIYSLRSIFEKFYVSKVNKYILALGVRIFALPLFLIPLFINPSLSANLFELPLSFWLATMYVSFVSTPIEMIFFYKALQSEEVSYLVPLLAISPLITLLVNFGIFRELPSVLGVIGVSLVIFGIYILNVEKAQKSILSPIRRLAHNPAVKYLSVMIIMYSIAIVIDKIAIKGANTYLYAFINYLFVSVSLLVIALWKARRDINQLLTHFKPFLGIGIIVALYTLLRFLALEQANSGYVSAILATSTVFTTLIALVFFKEKRAGIKIFVALLVTVGIILIKFA